MTGPDATPGAARPDVLALPSATASRAISLTVTILAAAAFTGAAVYNFSPAGEAWYATVRRCAGAGGTVPGAAANQNYGQCAAHVNAALIAFQVVAMLIVVVVLIAMAAALPGRIARSRRLQVPSAVFGGCVARCAELAREAGLRRPPRIWIGPAAQRDAFAFGLPTRYSIAIPRALAIRSGRPELFDPVIRHELQHVRRNDVAFAWVGKAVRWVLLPLLATPLVLEAVDGDASILGGYLWRAVLLAAAASLAAAGLLRAREFEADLGSADAPRQAADLTAVLAGSDMRRRRFGALTVHPARADRQAAIAQPDRVTRTGLADGLLAGLLAAVSVPVITGIVSDSSRLAGYAPLAGAVFGGLLLGTTIGLALCRQVLAQQVAGTAARSQGRVFLGVFAGYLAGQTSSLAGVGDAAGGFTFDKSTWIAPAAAMAAAVIIAGCARLVVLASPVLGRRAAGTVCVVLSGSVYAGISWMALILATIVQSGTADNVREALVTLVGTGGHMVIIVVCSALCLILVIAGRSRRPWPRWAAQWPAPSSLARPARPRASLTVVTVAAVASAAGGFTAITIYHWQAGDAHTGAQALQRVDAFCWIFALSGVAAAAALFVRLGLGGLAAGLLAAPLATAITVVLFVLENAALGGAITWSFTRPLLVTGLGLGVVLFGVLGGIVGAVQAVTGFRPVRVSPHALGRRTARPGLVMAMATAVCAAGLGALALGGRQAISPLAADSDQLVTGATLTPAAQHGSGALPASDDIPSYRYLVVPEIEQLITRLDQKAAIFAVTGSSLVPDTALMRVMFTDVVEPAQGLKQVVASYSSEPAPVKPVNKELVAGVQERIQSWTDTADYYGNGDIRLKQQAAAELRSSDALLSHWEAATAALP